MRAVLDTSVLIGAERPGALEPAISVASLVELHFGLLVARDQDERACRAVRLADPRDFEGAVARGDIERPRRCENRRGRRVA